MEQTTKSLAGKTALVTGSCAGIGYAMAEGLAKAGCDIVLHGIEAPGAIDGAHEKLAQAHGVKCHYLQADLAQAGTIESMMAELKSRHGGVDILINNAVTRHFSPIESFPTERWDQALAVNLSAAFHTIRLSLPAMRERGYGRIFNMTSVYGARGTANRIDYVTTKSALIGMTRAVAMETINQGITCNAICPGSVLTPNIDQRVNALMAETGLERVDAVRQFLAGKQPIQRFVDPQHVADLIVFLCGAAGTDITGTMLPIEGGWLAS